MPEWLKITGLYLLFLLGLTLLGIILGFVIVWLYKFWEADQKGNQKVKPFAEIVTGLSYLVTFGFLMFACWYEGRFLWRNNQPMFWSVIVGTAILASKWQFTRENFAGEQADRSFDDLIYEDKSSSFYRIKGYKRDVLAEKIKSNFAEGLGTFGSLIPKSALRYTVEDIKRAFKILSVHRGCSEEYRAALRTSFGCISNIYADDDVALIQEKFSSDILLLDAEKSKRSHLLMQLSHIKFTILSYEWDEWMLENGIKQAMSTDDIKQQADALNLTVDDIRDISPGHIPTMEEIVSNREKRAKNLPSV